MHQWFPSQSSQLWLLQQTEELHHSLFPIANALEYLPVSDDDIVVILDMDDWFANNHVLEDIVKTYEITELDLLFIDTEGHDYEILSALDLNIIKPKKIIFEHKHMEGTNLPIGEKYDKLINKFNDFGYKIFNKGLEDTELHLI
jgi:hypothetical protein